MRISSPAPRVLLIDDDPLFGGIFQRVAHTGNVYLHHIGSPNEVRAERVRKDYDLIICDYELKNLTALQMLRVLEAARQSLPTVLISSYLQFPKTKLPESVFACLHKSAGPQKILFETLSAFNKLDRNANSEQDERFKAKSPRPHETSLPSTQPAQFFGKRQIK